MNLPKDALIERCPGCGGLWLNRGELGKYSSHRESFKARRIGTKGAEVETLKHLQKELKLGSVALPTTLELASRLDSELPVNTKEVAKDLGFLALQTLLRLAFKI